MEDRQIQIENLINEGLSQFYSWNHSKAEEIFLKAFALDPDNAQVLYQLGSSCFYQGRLEESIEYFKKAARISSDDAHYHFVLGFALMAKNELKEAAAELERSIEIDGSDSKAYKNLGEIYYLLDSYEKSAASFAVVAEIEPFPENYLNHYISLRKSGKKEAALDYLRSSTKNIHKNDTWYLVMRSYLGFIDTVELIDKIGEKIMPAIIYYHCGMSLLFDGNQKKACDYFKKCVETKCTYIPGHRRALIELEKCGK